LIIVKVATLLEFVGVRYLLPRRECGPKKGAEGARDIAQALVSAADQTCPYSRARGNINVSTNMV
jgi:hypothetical protein